MKPIVKASLLATTTILLFVVLSFVAGWALGLEGRGLWTLLISLWVLALAAGVLVFVLVRGPKQPQEGGTLSERVDLAFKGAQRRLRSSALASGARIGKLPAVLILGPSGSAKTTVFLRGGVNPELLAGEPVRGDATIPTADLNLWYGTGAVFVEAGGAMLDDAKAWTRLCKRLRPTRLTAALTGKGQAPRAAVVCIGADEFQKPGSAERMKALAGTMRERLTEVARRLGVRLPVYVVFTKSDRVAHFQDYVSSFTTAEAASGLGATFPLDPDPDLSGYATREGTRIHRAFDRVFRELSDGRLVYLPRMRDDASRGAAYEFPRELQKLTDPATELLLELCRPSQLDVSPFLRGCYFVGVRPVSTDDGAVAAAPVPLPEDSLAAGATAVFNVQSITASVGATPQASPGSRRVPQWVHLPPIFGTLVLGDGSARKVTQGGAGVAGVRRLLLFASIAAALVSSVALVRSYRGNKAQIAEAEAAVRGVAALPPAEAGLLDGADLLRLEALRATTERVATQEREGRPRRLGWGLYQGGALLPVVRRAYFDAFRPAMWNGAFTSLTAALDALPDSADETADYGMSYDDLKAYLIVTGHADKATADFLAPVLERQWLAGRPLDDERAALSLAQFGFYGSELPFGDPYDVGPDQARVDRSRDYLGQFAGEERFYQSLVSTASDAVPGVDLARDYPTSVGVVRSGPAVAGAFTEDGWQMVDDALENIDQLLASEEWVLGEQTITARDRIRLVEQLRSRYTAEYVATWQAFLSQASVVGYGGLADASSKLTALAGNQSPLLRLLAVTSRNTDVDTADVRLAFQPVHVLVPPDQEDRVASDANAGYRDALRGLQGAVSQAANAQGPERSAAAGQAMAGANQARASVQEATADFNVDGSASTVASAVQRLLIQPIGNVEGMLRGLPAAEANQRSTAFCTQFNAVSDRYPFAPGATREASLEDVAGLLQPGTGALWGFIDGEMGDRVEQRGGEWVVREGARPQPSTAFMAFLNRAASVSSGLYGSGGGQTAQVVVQVRAQPSEQVPEISVELGRDNLRFTRTDAPSRLFAWEGQAERIARVVAQVGGTPVTVAEEPASPWAVFRLFQQGTWTTLRPGSYEVRWSVQDRDFDVVVELNFPAGAPIFRSDYLSNLECVSSTAR